MTYEEKYQAALAELAAAGFRPKQTHPPLLRLLHRLGMKTRPPLYNSFWQNTVLLGGYFGLLWGILMYALIWRSNGVGLLGAIIASLLAGLLFGMAMAGFYRYSAKKRGLTPWQDLGKKDQQ